MVIVLVVLIIGYLVLAYFAAKTWHVWHVVLLSGIFFAGLLFAFLAASNLKTQHKFRTQYTKALQDVEREQQRTDQLVDGDPGGGEDAEPPLMTLEGDVKRALVDRGRVWRNIVLGGLAEEEGQKIVTLNTTQWGDTASKVSSSDEEDFAEPEPDENDGAGAAAGTTPLGLDAGAIVFAFRDTPVRALSPEQQAALFGSESALLQNDANGMIRVPTAYLGEFLVTAVADDNSSISLAPTMEPDESRTELIADPNSYWVLYEIMPQDSHDVFQGMKPEEIQSLFPFADLGLDNQVAADTIREYVRDQKTAESADDPNRKWIRVKFNKPYSVAVDVQDPTPEPDSPFDGTGRAQSALLRQGEETKFEKDDEAILDFATAQQLEREQVVTLGEEIYTRQLRHYETAFRSGFFAVESLTRDIAVAQQELDSLNKTIESLKEQIAFRSDEQQKLIEDKNGFDYELQVVSNYRQELSAKWQSLKDELSKLYRANRQLAQRANQFQTLPSSAP